MLHKLEMFKSKMNKEVKEQTQQKLNSQTFEGCRLIFAVMTWAVAFKEKENHRKILTGIIETGSVIPPYPSLHGVQRNSARMIIAVNLPASGVSCVCQPNRWVETFMQNNKATCDIHLPFAVLMQSRAQHLGVWSLLACVDLTQCLSYRLTSWETRVTAESAN